MQRSVIIKLFLNEFVGAQRYVHRRKVMNGLFEYSIYRRGKIGKRGKGKFVIEKTQGMNNSIRLVRAKPIESRMLNRTTAKRNEEKKLYSDIYL